MSSMDDLIRAQMKNGNRNNANFWINRPGYGGDSDQDQEQDEAKKEEERIKRTVLYGRYNNFDNQGRMTPEYEYFLKEKEKHEREGLKGVFMEKDMTDEEREERFRNNPLARAYRYQKARHDRIVGWNHGNEEGQRKLFEKREKPDIDEMIRKQGKIGHGSYALTQRAYKTFFGKRDDKDNDSTGLTGYRLEFFKKYGWDPNADEETKRKQYDEFWRKNHPAGE